MHVEPRRTEDIHPHQINPRLDDTAVDAVPSCQSSETNLIAWFAEGQAIAVESAGVVMTIRYVCRKGRRARIAITGPAGAVFCALDSSETARSPDRCN